MNSNWSHYLGLAFGLSIFHVFLKKSVSARSHSWNYGYALYYINAAGVLFSRLAGEFRYRRGMVDPSGRLGMSGLPELCFPPQNFLSKAVPLVRIFGDEIPGGIVTSRKTAMADHAALPMFTLNQSEVSI